jgi:enamine deaminase RidA (YjgF/YER057c/UK114 family)
LRDSNAIRRHTPTEEYDMTEIYRKEPSAKGRSPAVAYEQLVFAVATAPGANDDMATQTRNTLASLDRHLLDAGSDRSRILSATVYVTDIAQKQAMDDVWCEWIGAADNWPQRACVQVGLAANTLVEITLTAARS